MPIEALRSVKDRFDIILRSVSPKRLARELAIADKGFHYKYFKGYRPEKIGRGRIRKIAEKEIFQGEGNELFANLIIVHWNERNDPVYQDMVTHVKTINEDVEAIEQIEDDKAHAIIDDLLRRHRLDAILLCVRLNGVRFSEEVIVSRLDKGEPRPTETEPEPQDAEAEASPEPMEPVDAEPDAPVSDDDAKEAPDSTE